MRFGAIDLLAPPAGRYIILFFFAIIFLAMSVVQFRIGILGFLTYKRAMSELSFQEVYITDPLHPYIRYIYTLCVYIRAYFLVFLSIFWYFYDFYGFFGFFIGFFIFLFNPTFRFLFRFSLKKEWGVQFSHFPFSDKFP